MENKKTGLKKDVDWKNKKIVKFVKAFFVPKSEEEMKNFLRDILSKKEIEEFANRLEVARMLSEGLSYKEIEKKTGMSSTTIARISKWLNSGNGGYKNVLKNLKD